jgi:hypothetical protein
MTTTTNPARPPAPPARPTLPKGLKWSNVWRVDGQLTEHPDVPEVPVNDRWEIAGTLLVCPVADCSKTDWQFEAPANAEDAAACVRHLTRLVPSRVDASDSDPVRGAAGRAKAHIRGVYERRRQQAVAAAQVRLAQAQQAVADAARTTAADMRGHVPSIAASATVLAGGSYLELTQPVLAAAVGFGMGSVGAVAAYLVAYWVRRMRAHARADAKQARKDRAFARHIAAGTLAAGIWLVGSSTLAALPMFARALLTLLFGLLLMFAVNHAHWQELWATRHRLKDLARRRAEAEARRAVEEAARLARQPASAPPTGPAEPDESDPEAAGARMAAEWARIAQSQNAANAFPQMARTWINPAETRALMAPDENGDMVRIGWEYSGHAQPGTLVARQGMQSPVVGARDWLSAVLFDGRYEPSKISIVDRPNQQANRFIVMIAERFPLGDVVTYKGRAGIRRGTDGSLYGHVGRTLLGDDAERLLWTPGQAGGGGRYGVTGSGKSVVTQLCLLNDLYGGILPILWDGKMLMDFAEFIGVIPCGCTKEHRDVMYRSIRAEMERRQQMLTLLEGVDRHGRPAPVEALWVPERDGPPQRWTIEEFHMNARDQDFITQLTELLRLQRSSATMLEISTQGGGLADTGDSVLRDNVNQVAMQIMRMGDHQARLTGYSGDYMPSQLPRLPGMMLMVEADAPAVPVRAAFVHKRDEDGNIYDHLYDVDNNPILTAPALPPETLEVYEREGLMDLWRMGQGPGGKKRLLNSGPVSPSTVNPARLGPSGQWMQAADVLLAIVWNRPGCNRATIDGHELWRRPAAGGRTPDLSTVSRAATKLEKAGLLVREGTSDKRTFRLTDKGLSLGEKNYLTLMGAELERRAERHDEEKEID